jgi:glycogen debranching enzyme
MELQPLLHDLLPAAMAPTQAWSGADGQVRQHGAQGFYEADIRVLSQAVVLVDDEEPEVIAAGPTGPGAVEVISLIRRVDEPGPDPTVRLRRRRRVTPGSVRETLELTAATTAPVRVPLALHLACDLALMEDVKTGRSTRSLAGELQDGALVWSDQGEHVTVRGAAGCRADLRDPTAPVLRWDLDVAPGDPVTVGWELHAATPLGAIAMPAPSTQTWSSPEVRADDGRLPSLLGRALEDLTTLRMSTDLTPDDVFLAAGAPWFLTLFGRDAIWAARMLLPLGTALAGGTLRTLAARQGAASDTERAEEPGKILHEVRRDAAHHDGGGWSLPPVYYGTVDATPLWVCLLHDAWRWGLPTDEVEALLPAMEAALRWMEEHGDADADGFLEYLDPTGRGLANQGWKDSWDAVQWRDGTLATGPIALSEVQGYAYEAAIGAAALLDAFGRPGADRWRRWAARLAERFRAVFWVHDDQGGYPAIALDASKRPVDTLTSNIGHLLGTGLLDAEEEAQVARRLASPTMDSGYGLRTLSTDARGYWPLRYHGGSVWSHDTAIAIAGLARGGHADLAGSLIEGLLAAGSELGYRLPEFHSGDARGTVPAVVPYPAACQPQAWSAAAAVVVLSSLLGLEPDVPAGTLCARPMSPSPVGAMRVTGLRVDGHELEVEVDADGRLLAMHTDAPLRIVQPSR